MLASHESPLVFVAAVVLGCIALVIPWKRWKRRLDERRRPRRAHS